MSASGEYRDSSNSTAASNREGAGPIDVRVRRRPAIFVAPLSVGRNRDASSVALVGDDGRSVEFQTEVVSRWADGSIRWLLLRALVPVEDDCGRRIQAVFRSDRADDGADEGFVRSANSTISLPFGYAFPQAPDGGMRFVADGLDLLHDDWLVLKDSDGNVLQPRFRDVAVESHGPIRSSVRLSGGLSEAPHLRLSARIEIFSALKLVSAEVTIHNSAKARHPGGCWDLGDSGSFRFVDASIILGRGLGESARITESSERTDCETSNYLTLHQNSSGGRNWQCESHVNRLNRVPCSFRGYRRLADGTESKGERAEPIVTICAANGRCVVVSVPEFWQRFPKTIEFANAELRIGLLPKEWGDVHEVQGGERKTIRIWIDLDPSSDDDSLRWTHRSSPPIVFADDALSTNLLPCVDRWPNETSRLDRYLDDALQKRLEQRESADEYGWRNYGEVHADHEEQNYKGDGPLVSHYNNQFDCLRGFLLHYLRTRDVRWWELADPLARHIVDIDVYHTQQDRAAYNGGLFWLTDHYKHARTATHRTYSRLNREPERNYGGGPSCEHNYTSGLAVYYCLTGNADAKAAVLGLADWVVAMDDGRLSVLGFVDDGPTGLATATRDPLYHGPGRGAGNSVNALLDAWSLSGERHYLEFAEVLIQRSIHPADDVDAKELLNAEERWSYTVFLWSLAKYLTFKAEAREFDRMYAYGRGSLLHYTDWMLLRERPYFDRRDELEYPTEAWAAQEFRKANVFRMAAAFADGERREKLIAKGHAFADRAWADLESFSTRATARAMAIVMTEGLMDACFREHLVSYPAGPDFGDFGVPERFVPQKARVKAALKSPRGLWRMGTHLISRLMRGDVT